MSSAYRYPPDGLELQKGEVFGQLDGLQVVEQQRGLAFLSLLLSLGQLPHPIVRRTKRKKNSW